MLGNFVYHNPTKVHFGADPSMTDDIVNATLLLTGGYKPLTKDDARKIIEASF